MRHRLLRRRLHRQHVHAIDLHAGNAPGRAVLRQVLRRGGALHRGAHAVFVVLDDVDHRQLHQRRQVEAFEHLALVGRAFAEIGQRDPVVAAIPVAEAQPGADADLRADDAVSAEEVLLLAEHVHRPALAVRVAGGAPGQLRHHAARVHAAGQHVAVVAIGGDDLVALARSPSACRPPRLPGRYTDGRSRRSGPCRKAGPPSPRSGGSAAWCDRPAAGARGQPTAAAPCRASWSPLAPWNSPHPGLPDYSRTPSLDRPGAASRCREKP